MSYIETLDGNIHNSVGVRVPNRNSHAFETSPGRTGHGRVQMTVHGLFAKVAPEGAETEPVSDPLADIGVVPDMPVAANPTAPTRETSAGSLATPPEP